ncbi:hypothetical protein JHK84_045842 [Glycine max]|nr:hypothetical protein JHK84_045842 [Glycine max]
MNCFVRSALCSQSRSGSFCSVQVLNLPHCLGPNQVQIQHRRSLVVEQLRRGTSTTLPVMEKILAMMCRCDDNGGRRGA